MLPSRVEGVIEERIGRLSPELRSLLNIASVDGQIFTAEVAARIEGANVRNTLQRLSRDLEGIHHLVKEQEELRINQNYLTRFRFGHALIQQYLYHQLGSGERRVLHAQIAEALQDLVQDHWQPFAAELAWHWQQAGRPEQAVAKWIWLGDQARAAYAHAEAENFYKLAVAELLDQAASEAAARTLMKLGLVYTADFQTAQAQEAYDRAFALWNPARRMSLGQVNSSAGAMLRLATEMPVSFDPGQIEDDVSTFLITQLFEGLARVGQDQNVLPAVASRWEILDEGTRYIFHLRNDAFWSDGKPLTAGDFVFAWTHNLHPQTQSPSAHLLYVLKNAREYAEGKISDPEEVGVSALNDTTLAVDLTRAKAYLPYLLTHTVTFPLPRHAVESVGKDWSEPQRLLGNGPYMVDSFFNNKLTLARNPHYNNPFSGNIVAVECLFAEDYETVLQAYEQDRIDMVNLIHADPDTIARAGSRFGKELVSIPRWSTFYLCFRCDKPPFDDPRVRQALAHTLDREALAVESFQGHRQAATGGFVPPGMPGHSPGIAPPFDPQLGQELLAQAGFAAGLNFPNIEWVSSPGGESVIAFIQEAWKKHLHLDLHPVGMNWEAFMEKLSQDPAQLSILGWGADIPDPANMLRATFHSKDGVNIPHWQNEQFDQLTDKAEQVTDHEQRMALYKKADQILVAEETAVLPLSYAQGRLLVKPWVRLPIASALSISFRFATVTRPRLNDNFAADL
jgi:oligopeptide transport system substrate-binding protein